ncbi:MAG TPA: serine protease [Ktedonosporobacter sp.]|nr:serine protease [Ktedonosporobacter sp.]
MTMSGLPGDFLRRLREALENCEEFNSIDELKEVFLDERLFPWRHHLKERDTVSRRVMAVITDLYPQTNGGVSVLLLLLTILRDRTPSGMKDRYQRLDNLANELKQLLASEGPDDETSRKMQANSGNAHMVFSVQWEHLARCIQAVGEITVPQIIGGQVTQRFPGGTGWLIAPILAMTCWHVLKARTMGGRLYDTDLSAQVKNSVLAFDYKLPGQGIEYQIDELECSDPTLDYAILRLKDRQDHSLKSRGFLSLDVDVPLTSQTELYVIQHPKGQPQQTASGRFDRYKPQQPQCIFHTAPAEEGTSGAPVINVRNWSAVAMHNGEDTNLGLREATLLKAILSHVQQTRPDLYETIMNAQSKNVQ